MDREDVEAYLEGNKELDELGEASLDDDTQDVLREVLNIFENGLLKSIRFVESINSAYIIMNEEKVGQEFNIDGSPENVFYEVFVTNTGLGGSEFIVTTQKHNDETTNADPLDAVSNEITIGQVDQPSELQKLIKRQIERLN